jgi:hypothetical protein
MEYFIGIAIVVVFVIGILIACLLDELHSLQYQIDLLGQDNYRVDTPSTGGLIVSNQGIFFGGRKNIQEAFDDVFKAINNTNNEVKEIGKYLGIHYEEKTIKGYVNNKTK